MVTYDRLPRGISGIFDSAPPPPSVDAKLFKSACHCVATHLGGSVGDFDAGLLARNHYACTLQIPSNLISVLCNATYPLIGFVGAGQYGFRELAFLPGGDIGRAFADLTDFKPLDSDFLNAALTAQHLTELAPAERDQVKHWQRRGMAERVGDVIFNSWD
ncbi:MAG TPA: hypothetical protein VL492_02000 [Methylovirgula sp.]|nr:hypothetical protein [Methylovirgula sp.]